MSQGEKTERATSKKRSDARKKGQVLKSQDIVMAFSLLIMVASIRLFGNFMVQNMEKVLRMCFTLNMPDEVTAQYLGPLFLEVLARFAVTVLPILGVALVAGVAFNVLQVGFMFTPEAIQPKLSKISMISGFKRLFSSRSMVELLKSVVKLVVLVWVAYNEYMAGINGAPSLMTADLTTALTATASIISNIALKMAVALLLMAPADFLYQWWRYEKDLRMTKQEVKDEYKMIEGDPQIKGKIRQKQREMSAMRMMDAVGGADVVITNPTHYAIALAYREGVDEAPVVVAKGKDYIAQKIKERAKEHHIEQVENRQLAQYLYFYCEIGDEVPEEVYQTVAEILAYIYSLKKSPILGGAR